MPQVNWFFARGLPRALRPVSFRAYAGIPAFLAHPALCQEIIAKTGL